MRWLVRLFWLIVPHHHGSENLIHLGSYSPGHYEIYECKKCGRQEAL